MDAPPGPAVSPDVLDGAGGPGVVVGVIGHDIHVVANRILTIGLAEEGFRPYNLGTNNDIADFADAAWETGARAVLVASINGEGEDACVGFGTHFVAAGLADVLRYAGGNLVVGDRSSTEVERRFSGYGFHRVFHRPLSLRPVFDALKWDLGLNRDLGLSEDRGLGRGLGPRHRDLGDVRW